jgi:hypothetical protein
MGILSKGRPSRTDDASPPSTASADGSYTCQQQTKRLNRWAVTQDAIHGWGSTVRLCLIMLCSSLPMLAALWLAQR